VSKTLELIFDFVSPNAYLVWGPLRELAERQGASLKITPVFLGGMHKLTGNAPPFIRDAEVKGKNAYAPDQPEIPLQPRKPAPDAGVSGGR